MANDRIKKILADLGLDLSDDDAKDGAISALEAILKARQKGGEGDDPNAQEIPDDLIPPETEDSDSSSNNNSAQSDSDDDEDDEDSDDNSKNNKNNDSDSDDSDGDNGDESDDEEEGESGDEESDEDESKGGKESDDDSDEDGESGDESDDDSDEDGNSGDEDSDDEENGNGSGEDDDSDSEDEDSDGEGQGDDSEEESEDEDADGSGEDEGDDENDDSEIDDSGEFNADDQDEDEGQESDTEETSDGDTSDADGEQQEKSEWDDDEDEGDEGKSEDEKNAEDEDDDWDPGKNWKDQEMVRARSQTKHRIVNLLKDALAKATAENMTDKVEAINKKIAEFEELQEAAYKSLYDMSDEEFRKLVDDSVDLAQSVLGDDVKVKDDSVKAQEIKQAQELLDQEKDNLNKEMEQEYVDAKRAEATSKREKERIARQNAITPGGLEAFKTSLLSALKLQIIASRETEDSWNAINQRYDGTGILQPGRMSHEVEKTKIPTINFYFDNSGSWDESKIAMGKKVVAMMAKMEQDGEIILNLYGFHDDDVFPIDSMSALTRGSGGTDCWNAIVKDIVATKAKNAIIMTDGDMEWCLHNRNNWYVSRDSGSATAKVSGHIWYLWCNGASCPTLARQLTGASGTHQFAFTVTDD